MFTFLYFLFKNPNVSLSKFMLLKGDIEKAKKKKSNPALILVILVFRLLGIRD